MRENWNGSERRQVNLDLHERIVRLESGQEHNKDLLEQIHQEDLAFRKELKDSLSALKTEITHYKGIIGGITLVISGLFALVAIAKGWIFGVK